MSDWKEYQLGELMEIKYGKDHKHLADGSFPLYGSGGIMRYVERPIYECESILIPRKGTLGNLFYMDKPFWAVDTIFWSKINTQKAFPKFLYYALKNQDLESLNVGSAVPSLTTEVLNAYPILIPGPAEQRKISEVLSALDNKIDLLHRQNKSLEGLAETLFRQWFIEEADESWEEYSLYDSVELIGGGTPKTSIEEYWAGNISWLSAGDISRNHKSFVMSSEKSISESGLNNSSAKLLPKYSTVITARGTVGKYCLLPKAMAFSQSSYGIMPKYKDCFFFTYLLVAHSVERLMAAAYGSVFDTITTNTFKEQMLALPSSAHIERFETEVTPFFEKMFANSIQICTLIQLRDNLLPKLMSGEIKIS